MSLEYEPSSEPLHISTNESFLMGRMSVSNLGVSSNVCSNFCLCDSCGCLCSDHRIAQECDHPRVDEVHHLFPGVGAGV